jgi:hypothetical protein
MFRQSQQWTALRWMLINRGETLCAAADKSMRLKALGCASPSPLEFTMTYIEPAVTAEIATITPQIRQTNAAVLSEKAVKHYRNAARLHEMGDVAQATTHANIARRHTVAALMACDADADL